MAFYSIEFDKTIFINRKKNIRRLSLRICRITGEISINAPFNFSIFKINNFFNKNHDWVRKQLKQCIFPITIKNGIFIPIEGVLRKIVLHKDLFNKTLLESKKLYISSSKENIGNEIRKFLIQYCQLIMMPIIEYNSNLMKKDVSKLNFKDTRSRWGSCSSKGNLMINWRLIMAPPSVYSYVIIHELAHLTYMDHGHHFWQLVKKYHPNYLNDQKWLKLNGKHIRRYFF